MFRALSGIMQRQGRILALCLVSVALGVLIFAVFVGPGAFGSRVEQFVVWVILGLLCFGGGYLVPYVQVRNPFAPKPTVDKFCVLGFWFFVVATILGLWNALRMIAANEAAPFGVVAPAAMSLGILQVWLNHFAPVEDGKVNGG
jgi:hypothetical protein